MCSPGSASSGPASSRAIWAVLSGQTKKSAPAWATLSMLLANSQQWFEDLQLWVDFNFAQGALFEGEMNGEAWAQLGTAGTIWLVVPLVVGLLLVRRSEVK